MTTEAFEVGQAESAVMYISFVDLNPEAQEEYLRFRNIRREDINEIIEMIAVIEREG